MLTVLWSMIEDETGHAMLEYGLLISCIALAALISVETFGQSVSGLFHNQGPAAANPWGR
jgi:Flp pilus assembly pilin Flp